MKLVSYDARSRRRSPELTLIDALFSLSTDNVESEPHRVKNTVSNHISVPWAQRRKAICAGI